jgi:hypothetical protein
VADLRARPLSSLAWAVDEATVAAMVRRGGGGGGGSHSHACARSQAQRLLDECDADGDGALSGEELSAALVSLHAALSARDERRFAFGLAPVAAAVAAGLPRWRALSLARALHDEGAAADAEAVRARALRMAAAADAEAADGLAPPQTGSRRVRARDREREREREREAGAAR